MKKDRQARILEIIHDRDIETQGELCDALVSEGYNVTQATVSRDIRKLNLSKVVTKSGKQKYVRASHEEAYAEKYIRILKDAFVSAEQAQNIIVIKSVAGMAMAVGAALDAMHMPGFVGCISGDDTILVVAKTNADAVELLEQLKDIVY